MKMRAGQKSYPAKARPDLLRSREGSGLAEFAIVMPVIILLILGSLTIYDALLAYRRTEDVAITVGSTLSKLKQVTNDDLVGTLIASTGFMSPFPPRNFTIIVATFTIDGSGNPTLQWCENWSIGSGGPCSGTATISKWDWETGTLTNLTVPSELRIPNSGLVVVRVIQKWDSPYGSFLLNDITMQDTAYFAPQASFTLTPPPRDTGGTVSISGTFESNMVK